MSQAFVTFPLSLEWLRRVVDPRIDSFSTETIKAGAMPAVVQRVRLEYGTGPGTVHSLILKTIQPDWPADPWGADRERRFYAELWPRLGLARPRVYATLCDAATRCRGILLEDLAGSHRFPPPSHCWSWEEMSCLLDAYADLHARGAACLPRAGSRDWLWRPALLQRAWQPDEIVVLYDDLVAREIWPALPGLDRLAARTLAGMARYRNRALTLLHNDVYPPNIALPCDSRDAALLLDWDMAGWGMAELDLAFMFMQPFRSAEQIARADALDYYWDRRAALDGSRPGRAERRAAQRHADALWALSLLPVAGQVAVKPYPRGSAAALYWEAMFGVLHERLVALVDGE